MYRNASDFVTTPVVLIIEDSSSQALKLKASLEGHGCRVYWAETGLGGLRLAQQHMLDLIVLDIELPDLSGFEVCRQLKKMATVRHVPVVMLTTLDEAEHVITGLEAGAVDYIPKDNFAELVLLETIRQMQGLSLAA